MSASSSARGSEDRPGRGAPETGSNGSGSGAGGGTGGSFSRGSGAPSPNSILTIVALGVIALLTLLTAIGIELERRGGDSRESLIVGSVSPQDRMRAQIAAAMIFLGLDPERVLSEIAPGDAPAGRETHASIAECMADAIGLAVSRGPQQALGALRAAADRAEQAGIADEAAPLLRVTASILRADPGADPRTLQGLQEWPPPMADDQSEARWRLGPILILGEALIAQEPLAEVELAAMGRSAGLAIGIFAVWLMLALASGLAMLVLLLVVWVSGEFRSGTGDGVPESEPLLEVFAVFMALLLGGSLILQVLLGVSQTLSDLISAHDWLKIVLQSGTMTVSTLLALGWWRCRGGSWSSLRSLAGLHAGRGIVSSLIMGAGGYGVALLLAIVGALISAVLALLAGERGLGDPTHPVYDVMESGSAGVISVLLLGAVLAPIIEEIFFRGVLYRGLRDRLAPRGAALVAGVLGAMIVSSTVFAAIHPQGLIFAPVLAGLGAGFCLVREWSGSVLPAIVAHSLNNGAVLLFTTALLA